MDQNTPTDVVTDEHNDVAVNENLISMRVAIPLRRQCQKMYVRGSLAGKGVSGTPFDPEKDAPSHWQNVRLTPNEQELETGVNMVEMLVVGLIVIDDALQYSSQGTGPKGKEKEAEKLKIGIINRPPRTSLALIEVTDYIRDQSSKNVINFFIACNEQDGVYSMRRITRKTVFFFQEFLPDGFKDATIKKRVQDLTKKLREAAAKNKIFAQTAQDQVPNSGEQKSPLPKTLKTGVPEYLGSRLIAQFKAYERIGDASLVAAARAFVERQVRIVKKKASQGGDAIDAFYDAERELIDNEYEAMLVELKSQNEDLPVDFDPILLKRIHLNLRERNILDKVPQHALVFILKMASKLVDGQDKEQVISACVEAGLAAVEINDECGAWPAKTKRAMSVAAFLENSDFLLKFLSQYKDDLKTRISEAAEANGSRLLTDRDQALRTELTDKHMEAIELFKNWAKF